MYFTRPCNWAPPCCTQGKSSGRIPSIILIHVFLWQRLPCWNSRTLAMLPCSSSSLPCATLGFLFLSLPRLANPPTLFCSVLFCSSTLALFLAVCVESMRRLQPSGCIHLPACVGWFWHNEADQNITNQIIKLMGISRGQSNAQVNRFFPRAGKQLSCGQLKQI